VGTHGNIVLYPSGVPGQELPSAVARRLLEKLEAAGLVRPGTSQRVSSTDDCSVTFEDFFEENEPGVPEYAYLLIEPRNIAPGMSSLVYLVPAEEPSPAEGAIDLPYLEITVLNQVIDIRDLTSGTVVARSWAAVEFSYEDARLSEEIHALRSEDHPVLDALAEVFGSEVKCVVVSY